MTRWPWRKRVQDAHEAVRGAERLRDAAEAERRRAEQIAPRVDAVSASLQKLRTDNHFGPLIEAILRGQER